VFKTNTTKYFSTLHLALNIQRNNNENMHGVRVSLFLLIYNMITLLRMTAP